MLLSENLYYYSPIYFFPQFFADNSKNITGYDDWLSIYKVINENVCLVDRSDTVLFPIKTKVMESLRLPNVNNEFSMSYEACCQEQAKKIISIAKINNKPIKILYSGGIDSTNLLISFIKEIGYKNLSDIATICMSRESFNENPKFYYDHIRGKLNFHSSEDSMNYLDGSSIVVGGEFNDQLFGSDLLRTLVRTYGFDIIFKKLDKSFLIDYFNTKIQNIKQSTQWVEIILKSSEKSFKRLENNWDFFWWYNFCFKWQSIYFRILAFTNPLLTKNINEEFLNMHYHHFYNSQAFQLWSISNDAKDLKIGTDWLSYKLEAKKLIYEFTGDENYFKHKVKRNSLYTILSYRKSFNFIDSNFNFLNELNTEQNMNRHHSFL